MDERISLRCEVLAHEKEDQVGRSMPVSLQLGGAGAKRAIDFAIATGILDPDDYAAHISAGSSNLKINFSDSTHKTFCTVLAYGKGAYAERIDIGFVFVDPTSPEADRYPRDKSVLEVEPDTSEVDDIELG
jgi:hypothetical protein